MPRLLSAGACRDPAANRGVLTGLGKVDDGETVVASRRLPPGASDSRAEHCGVTGAVETEKITQARQSDGHYRCRGGKDSHVADHARPPTVGDETGPGLL